MNKLIKVLFSLKLYYRLGVMGWLSLAFLTASGVGPTSQPAPAASTNAGLQSSNGPLPSTGSDPTLIKASHLLAPGVGWALTAKGLWWTDNDGNKV